VKGFCPTQQHAPGIFLQLLPGVLSRFVLSPILLKGSRFLDDGHSRFVFWGLRCLQRVTLEH
jgi:hypothetical protein